MKLAVLFAIGMTLYGVASFCGDDCPKSSNFACHIDDVSLFCIDTVNHAISLGSNHPLAGPSSFEAAPVFRGDFNVGLEILASDYYTRGADATVDYRLVIHPDTEHAGKYIAFFETKKSTSSSTLNCHPLITR
jgi:hypothetical protein